MNVPLPPRRCHLAPSEAARLWHAKQQGNEQARTRLIEGYHYLVPITVVKTVPNLPVCLEYDDLSSEANIALIKAVDRYDPGRATKFTSYAIGVIRGAVLEYLRTEDWIPRSRRDKANRARALLDQAPLPPGDLRDRLEEEARLPYLESLDQAMRSAAVPEGDMDDLTRTETLVDPAPGPAALTEAADQAALIRALVDFLPRRERTVIRAVYSEKRFMNEIAARFSLSESLVHQRHEQALHRLRSFAAASGAFADG